MAFRLALLSVKFVQKDTASPSCRTVCSAMLKIFEKNLLDPVFLGN